MTDSQDDLKLLEASLDDATRRVGSGSGSVIGPDASGSLGSASGRVRWSGKRLSHFRLMRAIGSGTMGVVFQAEDINLRRIVALKVMRNRISNTSDEERVELFFREARSAASIDHPNIVQIYEINEHQTWWYIAMEFLEGGNLKDMLKATGPLPPQRACACVADAASALATAHDEGLVHRDVKPANLMLTRNGRCKIADFGLVKINDPNDPFGFNQMPMGTPLYLAPEIIRRQPATAASDVYGLATTLFHILAGRAPYVGKNFDLIYKQHLDSPVPDVREYAPATPESLAQLLKRAMDKNPMTRMAASQLAAALRMELTGLSAGADGAAAGVAPITPAPTESASGSSVVSASASQPAAKSTFASPSQPDAAPVAPGGALRRRVDPRWLAAAGVSSLVLLLLFVGAGIAAMVASFEDGSTLSPAEQRARQQAEADALAAAQPPPDALIALRAEAEVAMESLATLEAGRGVDEHVQQATVRYRQAGAMFDQRRFDQATAAFEDVVAAAEAAAETSQQRLAATSARAEVSNALRFVDQLQLTNQTMRIVNEQRSADRQATLAFGEGDYVAAAGLWRDAARSLEAVIGPARAMRQLDEARQRLRDAIRDAEQHDITLAELQAHGGDNWAAVADALAQADAEGGPDDPAAAAEQLEAVRPNVREAIEAVLAHRRDRAEQRLREREARVASLLTEATQLLETRKPRAALEPLNALLQIAPDHAEANAMHQRVRSMLYFDPGQTVVNSIGMRLAFIPPGEFERGSRASEAGRDGDERAHAVRISRGFMMSVTEVTQAQWERVMNESFEDRDPPEGKRFLGRELPADGVSWHEAVAFCEKLSEMEGLTYRLPTEAEWEYAARAGTTTPFAVGASLGAADANVDGYSPYGDAERRESPDRTLIVGSFEPNAWGLRDMHGNVMEWVADWRGDYPVGRVVDPTGPGRGGREDLAQKVLRGGSWRHPAAFARSANRYYLPPVVRANYIGFRVVLETPQDMTPHSLEQVASDAGPLRLESP